MGYCLRAGLGGFRSSGSAVCPSGWWWPVSAEGIGQCLAVLLALRYVPMGVMVVIQFIAGWLGAASPAASGVGTAEGEGGTGDPEGEGSGVPDGEGFGEKLGVGGTGEGVGDCVGLGEGLGEGDCEGEDVGEGANVGVAEGHGSGLQAAFTNI